MTPFVSVVVPAYRSDATIAAFLAGLRAQTYRDFELIVVNSTPADATGPAVHAAFPDADYIASATRLLPHEARNRGVERASGELLVFTDPDCRARPDWLARLVEARRRGHRLVAGAMDVAPEATRFEIGVHLCKFWWALPGREEGGARVAPSANVAYERGLWDEIGPFPGGFSGDALLSWFAERAGAPPWFAPTAVVEHRHAGDVGALVRERLLRGAEFLRVRARHACWTRARLAATAAGVGVLPALVLSRAAASAHRAGWGARFAQTVDVQAIGHAAWSLGEARAAADLLRTRAFA